MQIEITPLNSEFAEGCLRGTINTSYADLVRLFGPPNISGDEYKVSTEWDLTFGADRFSLYDWKVTRLYDAYDAPTVEEFRAWPTYEWHIGGMSDPAGFITELQRMLDGLGDRGSVSSSTGDA